ncbi:MAG: Uma2 family endonuclease [Myxococcaceae bacterium]
MEQATTSPDLGPDGLVAPRRFHVGEYHQLADLGILDEDEHLELLEGVIVEMTPQSRPHARVISELTQRLVSTAGSLHRVRVQLPLTLSDTSEPEPDLAVVTLEEERSAPVHPRNALLVIEVASDSLRKDRALKGAIYAQAAIPEYWVANLLNQTIEVYADPIPQERRYGTMRTLGADELLTPRHLPGLTIPVGQLFA